jgi:cytochrome c peroxidase
LRRPRCHRSLLLRSLAYNAGGLTAAGALYLAALQTPAEGQPAPAAPPLLQQLEVHANPHGQVGIYLSGGPIVPAENAFFRPLGTNGRSCATCHRPSSGMSLSLRDVRARFEATGGTDPLFARVDGPNCPSRLPGGGGGTTFESAYSLLFSRATIRMPLPWPPRDELGNARPVEFDLRISPGEDPSGCNLDPVFGLATGYVSVYRRPPMVAQMNLKTVRPDGTGPVLAGSVAWDGRELSLEQQAIGATRGHAQADRDLTPEELAQIVQFESSVHSAQLADGEIGALDADGARGGPVNLAAQLPALGSGVTFDEYDGWAAQTGKRQSINRGQFIFNIRRFTISDVAGFNDGSCRVSGWSTQG